MNPGTTSPLADALAASAAEPLGPHFRGLPDLGVDATVGDVATAGLGVDELWWPVVTLRRTALRTNLEVFADWCAAAGVDHAPHGKTSLSPQLIAAQLAAGAWAITAATPAQARLMYSWGVRRIILANEVVDGPGLGWLTATLDVDPGFELYVLADSVAGVEVLAAAAAGGSRPLPVLLEVGVPGGRAGVRDRATAAEVAAAVAAADRLVLAGVECFEGVHPQDRATESVALVDAELTELLAIAAAADTAGHFAGSPEIVLTAGGSAYPDRVVAVIADRVRETSDFSLPLRTVVRSGGCLTHDHQMLARVSPLTDQLVPALELWARVLSVPEPGLAICGFGKRDASYDAGLPIPMARVAGGRERPVEAVEVAKLNDQHAFCVGAVDDWAVGDAVRFGLSHPCTVFDRWSLIPVIDDDDRVVDVARTYF